MLSVSRMVLVVGLLFAPLAHAAEDPVDTVTVEATRENVARLGKQVKMAQMHFYELYNQLNKNPDYAIECEEAAPTGTRFTQTTCQPKFKSNAEAEEARQFLIAFGSSDAATGTPGGVTGPPHAYHAETPPPVALGGAYAAAMGDAAGRPGFQKNLREITEKNPKLLKAAQEHAELWKRYYRLYRKLNGASPLPEENEAAAGSATEQAPANK
jgi:hypothetical protein